MILKQTLNKVLCTWFRLCHSTTYFVIKRFICV